MASAVGIEVTDLYRVITQAGTAGAFHDEAERQRVQADRFRWLGLAAIVLAFVLAATVLLFQPNGPVVNSSSFVAKTALALALGATATYLVRQSGSHRSVERRYRRLELELVALPPFLEDLTVEARERLKSDFVDRAFRGQDVDDTDASSIGKDQVTVFGQIFDLFNKFR